jgi:hypothetical protein
VEFPVGSRARIALATTVGELNPCLDPEDLGEGPGRL